VLVAGAVGASIGRLEIRTAFGLAGSGNLPLEQEAVARALGGGDSAQDVARAYARAPDGRRPVR
jgi:hypothetical protein